MVDRAMTHKLDGNKYFSFSLVNKTSPLAAPVSVSRMLREEIERDARFSVFMYKR